MDEPTLPAVELNRCPIETSLGVLGRKWTLVILRDVAFQPGIGFGDLLRSNPKITPRMLSFQLRRLFAEGIVERYSDAHDRRRVHYRLTPEGRDVVPVLVALVNYAIQHRPKVVFSDGRPRTLDAIFPGRTTDLLGGLARYARGDLLSESRPRIHGNGIPRNRGKAD